MRTTVDYIKKIASKSRMKFRMAALVYDEDEIVGTGFNNPYVSPKLANRGYWSVHAEIDALRKMDYLMDTNKLVMVVVRIKKDGSFGSSKPCPTCVNHIRKAGIKKVIYMNPDGTETFMEI